MFPSRVPADIAIAIVGVPLPQRQTLTAWIQRRGGRVAPDDPSASGIPPTPAQAAALAPLGGLADAVWAAMTAADAVLVDPPRPLDPTWAGATSAVLPRPVFDLRAPADAFRLWWDLFPSASPPPPELAVLPAVFAAAAATGTATFAPTVLAAYRVGDRLTLQELVRRGGFLARGAGTLPVVVDAVTWRTHCPARPVQLTVRRLAPATKPAPRP